MNTDFIVDVPMCVYNQEKFIAEAIEGVINQKTHFRYRLIIGEDCSTDNTREIVRKYQDKYPDKILVIYHDINIGPYENSKWVFEKCTAKYIALCDGDDYWTDPLKLQKQVDFLNNNNDFAICFHNSKVIYEDDNEKFSFTNPDYQPEITKFEDLAKGEFIYTVTCLFRLNDFRKLPKKYYRFINNYTLDLHNAQYGKIKYIDEVMSVYRRHRGGMWSMVERERTLIDQLPTYKFYLQYFNKKYKKIFKKHLRDMTAELLSLKIEKSDLANLWKYYFEYIKYNSESSTDVKHAVSIFLKVVKKKFINLFKNNE